MPDRDPRIDPQRGDLVRGNGQVRRVMARDGDRVRCSSGVYGYRMRLMAWRTKDRGSVVRAQAYSMPMATLYGALKG